MSLPSFPSTPLPDPQGPLPGLNDDIGGGAGDHLPAPLLWVCGLCTLVGMFALMLRLIT
jgi:hypothetical protein